MKKYIYIIATMLFASCEKTVENVIIPETKPKLVVYSYISPEDSIISAFVSMSVPIFDNSQNTSRDVTDAKVIISDGEGHSAQLLYTDMIFGYHIPASTFPIVAGKIYHLNVSTPDGKSVDASCTVPLTNNNTLQFVSLDSTINEYNYKEYSLRVNFRDTPNQQDYYRIYPIAQSGYNDTVGMSSISYQKMYFNYGNENVDDINKDGQTFSYTLNYSVTTDPQFANDNILECFKIYLFHVDTDYYEFHKSISNYQGDNPFSEPALIYSNMNGGYGVFAAYNSYVLVVSL